MNVHYVEETAANRIASQRMAHLSIEVGHLYMEDYAAARNGSANSSHRWHPG